MKTTILLTAIAFAALFAQGDANREKLVKENLKAMDDVTAVLKTVKDKDTAEIVVPRLEVVMKRLDAVTESIKKIPANDADLAKVNKSYAKELKAARDALAAEDGRLQKLPELNKILFKSPTWAWAQFNGKGAVIQAKLDVKGLDQAVTAYYLRKHHWPESLWILTERDPIDNSPALLQDQAALIDPWGNAYQYEPQTFNPKTDKPLIYSNGPPGSNVRITNWD
ncbi:MAG TPA: type II secretion system protein GspG [Gemmataceae bacterium]|nr:type II secretion system protein GspG [Gemmataceae bacterium]